MTNFFAVAFLGYMLGMAGMLVVGLHLSMKLDDDEKGIMGVIVFNVVYVMAVLMGAVIYALV